MLYGAAASLEFRSEGNDAIISGAFPYGAATTLGTFGGRERREQFVPGAFAFENVALLAQHTFDRPLASVASRTLTLRNESDALHFEARITPDVANVSFVADALALIRAGLAKGLSPGFVVDDETVSDDGHVITRTVTRATLHELSVVTRPAYPQAQVEARSWTATIRRGIRVLL